MRSPFDAGCNTGQNTANSARLKYVNRVRFVAAFLLALLSCLAATIEPDPTKQKGAGRLFQIHYGDNWGFMDRAGRIVIRPQFAIVGDFFNGMAVVGVLVGKAYKYCFIDETGKTVIPCTFDAVRNFSEGMAPVRVGRLWGYIDTSGKMVIQPQFQGTATFSNGLGRVEVWDRIQCMREWYTKDDAPGHLFAIHDSIFSLTTGCFPEHQRFGYVNRSGDLVIKPAFFMAQDFSEGFAAVRVEESAESRYAFIDRTGKIVIPAQFDQADAFSEGLAAVETGSRFESGQKVAGKWGFIDRSGNLVISPRFELAGTFSEGLARACDDVGAWGFIDRTGRFAISPEYILAGDFSEGLAVVWSDKKSDDDDAAPPSAYIDRHGKKVLTLKRGHWPFSDGLTVAGEDGKRVYVNKTGKVVARYEVNPGY